MMSQKNLEKIRLSNNLKMLGGSEKTKRHTKNKLNKLQQSMETCRVAWDSQLHLYLVLILKTSEQLVSTQNLLPIRRKNKLMIKIILLLLSTMIQVVV